MKRFFAFLLTLVVLFCTMGCSKTPSAEKTTLKIIQFNIQTHANGEFFSIRSEMLRDFIAEMQPDSIGMQEATATWRKELDSFCFGENYSGVGNANKQTGEMNPIYYRNDKFELVDSGTFWLSDTPGAASKFEESLHFRVCTWARLKEKQTSREFVHLNIHLDNDGDRPVAEARALRVKQGKAAMDFVKKLGNTPLILTGDFNQVQTLANGDTAELYQLVTEHFADARMTATDTVSPTEWASMVKFHQPDGEKYRPSAKPIDYIFYTPNHFEATVYRNIYYVQDEIFTISDHLPQYAEFVMK